MVRGMAKENTLTKKQIQFIKVSGKKEKKMVLEHTK